MREIRSFSLIFADFCRFSLILVITAFRGRRFSQKTAGNRRFSQKTAGNPQIFAETPLSHLVCPWLFLGKTENQGKEGQGFARLKVHHALSVQMAVPPGPKQHGLQHCVTVCTLSKFARVTRIWVTTPEKPRKIPRTLAEPRRDPPEPSERPRRAL